MSTNPLGFRRWRSIRERAFSAHVAALDDDARERAIAELFAAMNVLRAALDDDDAAVFDAMLRRDHAVLLLAESSVGGAVDPVRLRAVVRRETLGGRLAEEDAAACAALAGVGADPQN